MDISGNTILITGGATGIGFALAEHFIKAGNEIIICGRRENKLEDASMRLPEISTFRCDVANPSERESFSKKLISEFPDLNIIINNAGIQKMIDFNKGTGNVFEVENEIAINFEAPVHFSALFIEHLKKQKESAIINISSGLGFIPLAMMPVYCATKAAIHSFSISLRHQLKDTNIKVFEIIPPIVDTELDRGTREARGMKYRGIPASEVAEATLIAMKNNEYEAAVGQAKNLVFGARNNPAATFNEMNK